MHGDAWLTHVVTIWCRRFVQIWSFLHALNFLKLIFCVSYFVGLFCIHLAMLESFCVLGTCANYFACIDRKFVQCNSEHICEYNFYAKFLNITFGCNYILNVLCFPLSYLSSVFLAVKYFGCTYLSRNIWLMKLFKSWFLSEIRLISTVVVFPMITVWDVAFA